MNPHCLQFLALVQWYKQRWIQVCKAHALEEPHQVDEDKISDMTKTFKLIHQ